MAQMLKTTEMVQISFLKIKLLLISLHFFSSSKFSPLDPDTHIECGCGSRRENEYGSMRIRILSPVYRPQYLVRKNAFLSLSKGPSG